MLSFRSDGSEDKRQKKPFIESIEGFNDGYIISNYYGDIHLHIESFIEEVEGEQEEAAVLDLSQHGIDDQSFSMYCVA